MKYQSTHLWAFTPHAKFLFRFYIPKLRCVTFGLISSSERQMEINISQLSWKTVNFPRKHENQIEIMMWVINKYKLLHTFKIVPLSYNDLYCWLLEAPSFSCLDLFKASWGWHLKSQQSKQSIKEVSRERRQGFDWQTQLWMRC